MRGAVLSFLVLKLSKGGAGATYIGLSLPLFRLALSFEPDEMLRVARLFEGLGGITE